MLDSPMLRSRTTDEALWELLAATERIIERCPRRSGSSADAREMQILACEPRLHGHAGKLGGNRFKDTEHARDRHELCVKFLEEHPGRRLAARAGPCAAAQGSINMETAVRHDLRPGADAGIDDEVTVARIDP